MSYEIIKHMTTISKNDFLKLDEDVCFLFNNFKNDLEAVVLDTNDIDLAYEVFSKCKAEINIKKELLPCIYLEIVQYELWEETANLPNLIGNKYLKENAIRVAKNNTH